ncbi:2-hydroxychromene-2-carboxylate isomerase [Breoghania corrubedonensis]|uniref:2-hydroxychromene-2-carboxylate isomerase n=1 Tax=Breoghania corrubedonensis TaxID=665038 RepID=A0A2T5VEB7_9HYPH|nr:2-hydroxychromene-2-carboxylate isomerase [Breoghania corrubedonensis]PTW62102.1 2-hydroxychromene-2-carboxylate isomerase [Breoghania corrubedonensis]
MTVTIDYYFTLISPFAYLGHDVLLEIAEKRGAGIRYYPVNLGAVFSKTGGLPLPQRHPARQAYRWLELQRWREVRERPLNLRPAHFPTDPTLADCTAIVLAQSGGRVADFAHRAFRACWELDRDIADEHVISGILDDLGEYKGNILASARSEEVRSIYADHARQASEAGAFGSPVYVLNGEVFWGQDRLDLLDQALASGRAPYRPL